MPASTGAAADPGQPGLARAGGGGQPAPAEEFPEERPDVEIVAHGYWQVVIPQASGETIITRYVLGDVNG